MLLRANPSADKVVADSVCQRQVVVAIRGDVAVLDHRIVDVATERLLDVGHVLDQRDPPHADLLTPILVGLRLGGHRRSRTVTNDTTRKLDFDSVPPLATGTSTPRDVSIEFAQQPTTSRPSTVTRWVGHLHTIDKSGALDHPAADHR